jgi:hypothetical protein
MEEILHQLTSGLSHYSKGFNHPRCRISSIHSTSKIIKILIVSYGFIIQVSYSIRATSTAHHSHYLVVRCLAIELSVVGGAPNFGGLQRTSPTYHLRHSFFYGSEHVNLLAWWMSLQSWFRKDPSQLLMM